MNVGLKFLAVFTVCIAGQPARAAERRIEKEIVIAAPRNDVWHAWTTAEGITQVAPMAAKIELKPGGAYEWYFAMSAPAGQRGGEGCKVLAFVPQEFLAVTWNAPPSIPSQRNAGAMTQLFFRFTEVDSKTTRVSVSHLITGEGADWDKYYSYFDRAWGNVLAHAKTNLEKPDRKPAPTAAILTVPPLVQSCDINVSADKLWQACVDPAVVKKWAANKVEIDLKLGGVYRGNYNLDAGPNDDTWIVREIVCLDPGRLIALQMKQAPAKFPHKAAIERTTHLLFVEPLGKGKSRLRLVMTGMEQDDGSMAMREYFEKANPTVFAKLKQVLEAAP